MLGVLELGVISPSRPMLIPDLLVLSSHSSQSLKRMAIRDFKVDITQLTDIVDAFKKLEYLSLCVRGDIGLFIMALNRRTHWHPTRLPLLGELQLKDDVSSLDEIVNMVESRVLVTVAPPFEAHLSHVVIGDFDPVSTALQARIDALGIEFDVLKKIP